MKQKKTSRGRPIDPESQKERKNQLIDAAYDLLHGKSYRDITIREIAEQANTKSAMISYYFGGKQGLFLAMMEREENKRLASLIGVLEAEDPLKAFIYEAIKNFSEDRAITRFIADDVMHVDGPLRDKLVNTTPKKIAQFLPSLIIRLQQKNILRLDIDPKKTAFSLMNMIVMPHISAFVREQAWGISHEEISGEDWAEHIYQLFLTGCQNTKPNEIEDKT
mgnify:CR=1 FL=1